MPRLEIPIDDALTCGAVVIGGWATPGIPFEHIGPTTDQGSGEISGTYAGSSAVTVVVRATDADELFAKTVLSSPGTRPPVFDTARALVILPDGQDVRDIDVSAAFTDSDEDGLTFSAPGFEDTGLAMTADGVVHGRLRDAGEGILKVGVTASDGRGGTVGGTVTLAAEGGSSSPPSADGVFVTTGTEIALHEFGAMYRDNRADALPIRVTGLPEGLTFDPETGLVTGVVPTWMAGGGLTNHWTAATSTVSVEYAGQPGGPSRSRSASRRNLPCRV